MDGSTQKYDVGSLTPHGAVLEGGQFLAPESDIALTLLVPGYPPVRASGRVVHAIRTRGGPWRMMLVLRKVGNTLRNAVVAAA